MICCNCSDPSLSLVYVESVTSRQSGSSRAAGARNNEPDVDQLRHPVHSGQLGRTVIVKDDAHRQHVIVTYEWNNNRI